MKIPKKEKHTGFIEIERQKLKIPVTSYFIQKPVLFRDNNPFIKIKIKHSKDFKRANKDVKAFLRLLKRFEKHGWKSCDEEKELQNANK